MLRQKLFRASLCVLYCAVCSACQLSDERRFLQTETSTATPSDTSCLETVTAFRHSVDSAGVSNASTPPLAFNPLLHSNRFLEHLAHSANTDRELTEWTSLLADAAIQSRASENANLAEPWSDAALGELALCSRSLATDIVYGGWRKTLAAAVREASFPEHYIASRQNLGALALLRPIFRQRILALHADEREWFLAEDEFESQLVYDTEHSGLTAETASEWMRAAYANNALELPLLQDAQLDALFARHAPALRLEEHDDNDRIGSPRWQDDRLVIDTGATAAYRLASMTQFEGRNLLQLNYVFWLPARKSRALIDLYSGAVDSLIWRVTLDETGEVLLYDSIHSCGCYHKYFVASESVLIKSEPSSREPANIFTLDDSVGHEILLSLTANEHYIVGVESKTSLQSGANFSQTQHYRLLPYSQLQNLKKSDGKKSLFDENGLIAGSERLERFTLWPTGILSVGAMRQWGTHATGFVEEQHFDDPLLLEQYFRSRD